jgi:hypothetical protein
MFDLHSNQQLQGDDTMKTIMMGVAAALMFGAGAVSANQGGTDPYSVQPHEVELLNKAPSAADIAKICENKADFRKLAGGERDTFLMDCKKDV